MSSHAASRVDRLLYELSTELGYSMAIRELARFENLVPLGIDAFTDAVLVAEGLDPIIEKRLRKDVRARVARHFALWETSVPEQDFDKIE